MNLPRMRSLSLCGFPPLRAHYAATFGTTPRCATLARETPLTTESKIRKACSPETGNERLRRKEVRHGIRQIGKAAGLVHGRPFGQLCNTYFIGQHCGRKR